MGPMRYRLSLVFLLCASAGLAPVAAAADPARKPSAATLDLYKTKCQSCHMPDGNAPLEPMNLADDKWKHGGSQREVARVIAEGVPQSAMLPFKAQLSPAQVAALAAYVRSFDKTQNPGKSKK